MLRKLPKNLAPQFIPMSRTPNRVLEIIEDTLDSPVKIPNYLHRDTPFDDYQRQIAPYNIKKQVAEYQNVDPSSLMRYFNNYRKVKNEWEDTPFQYKKDIFLKAADLIENKYYYQMLAYTMVGQNKNIYEAEIDSVCELVDFLRFNVAYAEEIMDKQPIQVHGIKNVSEYNSLNGFVAAITPFNFTAIGGNLATAPILFGNSVLWKPSQNAILSNHLFYEIMLEAGLPEGILNFCPMEGSDFLNMVAERDDLGALLFTGSSDVFNIIHSKIMGDVENRKTYPRIIGETGGKNFHFIDKSCDENVDDVVNYTIESAFNYSGQKCSACSVMYVPEEMLDSVIETFKRRVKYYNNNIQNYGLINEDAYLRVMDIYNSLLRDDEIEFVSDSGNNMDSEYFVSPKVMICRNHSNKVFHKEFFAPIVSIYPYQSDKKYETMEMCASGNAYSLTGSIFSNQRDVIDKANRIFRHKTGNFYINDKSTGSVVGQQPFGGSGKSGTNDKAGDINLLFRLFNQRNLKINLAF